MVESLKQKGYKVLIITNGHAEIQRGKLKRLCALDLFDGVLVGGEEVAAGAAEKPAASIFLKACELAGCTPDEVLHAQLSFPLHLACTSSAPTPGNHRFLQCMIRQSLQGDVTMVCR
jgi:hypothetical protein